MSAFSSADVYMPSNGYIDPNKPSPTKKTVDLPRPNMAYTDYENLIRQLSTTQLTPGQTVDSLQNTPEASHTPSYASSEGNVDEAQTPPDAHSYTSHSGRHSPKSTLSPQNHQQLQQRLEKARHPSDAEYLQRGPQAGLYSSQLLQQQQQQQAYGGLSGDQGELEVLDEYRARPSLKAQGKLRSPITFQDEWRLPVNSEPNSRRRSANTSGSGDSGDGPERPYTKLSHQDIVFRATALPERSLTAGQCREMLAAAFPALCEAPVREFDEAGAPLPPTKKREASPEERQARREALTVGFVGKSKTSLVKAMVILEARSGSWKRIGSAVGSGSVSSPSSPSSPSSSSSSSSMGAGSHVRRLPPMPSPWSIEMQHQDLDVAAMRGRSKHMFELPGCRQDASCHKCHGKGTECCATCRGEAADECFWCAGTGREKTKATCHRCHGEKVLKCTGCNGSLTSKCKTCDGSGSGHYAYIVEIKVKRVEMPAVPVSSLVSVGNPSSETVRSAATLQLLESAHRLTLEGSKHSKPYIPVMAACSWETSVSNIVEVKVPLNAKFKKGANPALRPEGLQRKIPTATRFFSIPSDADLKPVEMTFEELDKVRLAADSLGAGISRSSLAPAPASEPVTPAAREFVARPSPLSQLASTPSVPGTPVSGGGGSVPRFPQHEMRRPSYGNLAASKLISKLQKAAAV